METGGVFRHNPSNGAAFNVGVDVPFSVNGGTLQATGVIGGALNLDGIGTFTNATLVPSINTTINFSGNNNTIIGTVTGSGAGRVNLGTGQLHATGAGATLNFPAGLFDWSGNGSLSGPGIWTNTGTIQIASGDPNLQTELVNAGKIQHFSAFLDLEGAMGKLRVIAGGLYESVNTGSGFGFRAFSGTPGVFVEAGAVFRHAPSNGAAFQVGPDVPFSVNGGTLQATGVIGGALLLNGIGTFTNANFAPSVGTVIDFSGNNNTIIGTLTGTGAGKVNLGTGQLHATAAGATLSFPAGMFDWSGSGTLSGPGVFTNAGAIQIVSGDPDLATELVNAGTIQHFSAFFDLDGAAAKLRVVSGGLYESVNTGSGFGFRATNGTPGVFVEAGGTFRHNTSNGAHFAVGAGTPFSNLGTVAVANGALNFTTVPAQISGATATATLTGGAWEVANGATLNLGITGLASNAASITVRGSGGFTGISALASNSGSLSLLAGADLATTQAFANSGALTLSAGSVLTAPSFSQSLAGSVAFEIGGATLAQLGRIVTTGAATLLGTANISVAASFSPAAGQNFPLISFASRNGSFASVTGLNVAHANLFEIVNAATNFSLNSLVNASNLAVEAVSTPGAVAAGNDVSFSYTVRNTGAFVTPVAAWNDTVYLSRDGVLDSSDIVLTRITHTGAVAAGATYTSNVSIPLVGALPANYQLIVVADTLGRVADTDRTNNTLASTGGFTLSIPTLTAGVAFNGTIVNGRDQYFQITLPAGPTPTFTFTGAVAGQAEIYESIGSVPTRADFFEKAFVANSAVQRIVGDVTAAATYYILVHGRENAGAGQTFSLVANGVGFDLSSSSIAGGPNIGKVTTTLSGTQFSPATTFTLVSGGTTRAATATYFRDGHSADATFDLTGLTAGSYNIVANNGGPTDTLTNAFTVTNGGTVGTLSYDLSVPRYIRPPFVGTVATLTYENTGQTDLAAPIFNLFADNARLRLADQPNYVSGSITMVNGVAFTVFELLGVSGGLAGVLSPGEKGTIQVFFEPINSATNALSHFEVLALSDSNTPLTFAALKADMKPAQVDADAWDAVFANFQTATGGTIAGYHSMLVDNANYLGQFGPVSPEVTKLVAFELQQADDFGVISARYEVGDMGRGNVAPFSQRLFTDSLGNVTIAEGALSRSFVKLANGTYSGAIDDVAKLVSNPGGGFTLTETDGLKTVFRASDGRMTFLEDLTGKRLTASYNAGNQLTALTESLTGDVTNFAYNTQGRLISMTDPVGRVTTYGYDASNQHLTSVTTPQGTTTYTYVTGQGPAREHAIASITSISGVVTTFSYDVKGRLTERTTGSGPGAVTLEYSYDSAGRLTAEDAEGNSHSYFRGVTGGIIRDIDPFGNLTSASVDAAGRIVKITESDGSSSKLSYEANGLLGKIVNADRTSIGITTDATGTRIQSYNDARGGVAFFDHSTAGQLIASILPDGSKQTFEYDASGHVIASTDANGGRTTFTVTTTGLITSKTLPDGSLIDYTYDARRNLLTATDAGGATTYTYDAADRITSASYPNGKTITLTYDSAGRKATVKDQNDYIVRYSYDSLGRLDTLRDTGNALLVDYGYDTRGQLSSEVRGNGSRTDYTYDAGGRAATIVHRDANNTIIAQFAYTYDALNRVNTETTSAGTATYAYDLQGQLTGAALPGGRTITYSYDAEGNRTVVNDSTAGVENYTTNVGDAYTTAGAETLTYDQEGRLIARVAGGVTTSYAYDFDGRLISVISPGSVITYHYDAVGNRIGTTTNGVRTDFAYDPTGLGMVFGEYTNATATNYASGLGVAVRSVGGSNSYYHFDAGGNTAALTSIGGTATASYQYLPFGEIAAQSGASAQLFTFDGRFGVQDDAGDLYQMRARTYDAGLGRFTTRDPIGFNAGDTNFYRFVSNDPVNRADPSGLLDVFAGVTGTAIAGSGVTGSAGVFANTSDPWDVGFFVAGGIGGGFDISAGFGVGTATDISGDSYNVNGGAGALSGTVTTDTSGKVIGGSAGASLGSKTFAGGSVTRTTTAKISPRALADTLGFDNPYKANEEKLQADKQAQSLIANKGNSALFNQLFADGKSVGLSDRDALLSAITFLRKNGIYDPKYNPTPKPVQVVRPSDPNNIVGPAGFSADPVPEIIEPGQTRFDGFVSGNADFSYKIEFENKPSATAPAQVVYVTQTLDADLDLTTFEFKSFAFGAFTIPVPAGSNGTSFHTIFDATATLGVLVQIDAALNTITRELSVTYTSLDPATKDVPLDPFAGFLPPDDATGRGDGFLTYIVAPKAGLANATEFTGIASIVFDTEDAIATPTVTNTLDSIAPTSSITAFAGSTTSRLSFPVRWTGADNVGGSGVAGITLSFTDNDGPLQTATVANADGGFRFTGVLGHTYKFFSQAVDNVGNTSTIPGAPERTITVVAPTLISNKDGAKLRTFTDEDGDTYTIALTGPGTLNVSLLDPDNNGKGSIDQIFLTGSTAKSKVTVTVNRAKDGPDPDKLPDGDGIVTIGDINITGDLGAFTAKASDFTVDGILATGAVGKVTVRDMITMDALVGTPGVKSVGTLATKTKFALTARNIGDGAFSIGNTITAIKAASIGDASIVAPTLGSLVTTVGALNASLTIAGSVGAIVAKQGANSGQWNAGAFGAITLGGKLEADVTSSGIIGAVTAGTGIDGDIDADGSVKSVTVKAGGISGQITGATIGAVSVTGGNFAGFIGADAAPGKVKGLTSLTINGGSATGDILVAGNVGTITVKAGKTGVGGGISGDLTANSFGLISATGGNLSGTVKATGSATSLGKVAAIAGLSVIGGDIVSDIAALGALGAISVKASKSGVGGSITDSNITASKIAAITVAKDFTDSILLAGADLGTDRELGGGDDTFAVGSIGKVGIGGNVTNSAIGAGLSTTNAILKDSDDSILGSAASVIAGLIIKGTADPASYFAAGKFASKVSINSAIIADLTTDGRFKVA